MLLESRDNTLFSDSIDSTIWNTTLQEAIGTGRPSPPRVDAIGSPVSFVNGIIEVRRSHESESDGSLQWNMWDPNEVSGAGGASPSKYYQWFCDDKSCPYIMRVIKCARACVCGWVGVWGGERGEGGLTEHSRVTPDTAREQ